MNKDTRPWRHITLSPHLPPAYLVLHCPRTSDTSDSIDHSCAKTGHYTAGEQSAAGDPWWILIHGNSWECVEENICLLLPYLIPHHLLPWTSYIWYKVVIDPRCTTAVYHTYVTVEIRIHCCKSTSYSNGMSIILQPGYTLVPRYRIH